MKNILERALTGVAVTNYEIDLVTATIIIKNECTVKDIVNDLPNIFIKVADYAYDIGLWNIENYHLIHKNNDHEGVTIISDTGMYFLQVDFLVI